MLHFIRHVGDQRRIDGSRRLSDLVLMDFHEDLSHPVTLFAPPTRIDVALFVPGPQGPLAQRTAAGACEVVAAICALALGRPVDLPPSILPADDARAANARSRRRALSILGLARDSVSLDVFGELPALGGPESVVRVRGSLLSYHAALRQASPDVATMLLVTAIEALIAPWESWGKEKVTKRFIENGIELCGDDIVNAMLAHQNLEAALDYRKRGGPAAQRKQLFDRIYELRSNPSHAGLGLSGSGLMSSMGSPPAMRVALLSDIARHAILNFIQAPRSSIVGMSDRLGAESGASE
jgi:hypothetical protein